MTDLGAYVFVFVAGLITALATGLGAIPFFLVDEISDRWNVVLWGLASGIMLGASLFGLVGEGLAYGTPVELGIGVLAGVVLVVVAHEVIEGAEVSPKKYEEADMKKLLLILGVLTVHSFPEGVAVGVSFAELGFSTPGGLVIFGTAVPLLAVFMTVAISIHNVPEGVAVSIPLRNMNVAPSRMVWWAVFSSLPQPLGAVIAFYFVTIAQQFLPIGFGFAAGAMVYLVLTEFIPEALELGEDLAGDGKRELVAGMATGAGAMIPLLSVTSI
ncbi:ZIP family metal transporter [Halobaculum limi]|uniref:ZIP family metal transporter n=1 Tax=Halobaculum limi TaxID=3031916 RepID=UPI0024063516|nr:ZIP family metal transporter [Halobaculum sp. YSMS11]